MGKYSYPFSCPECGADIIHWSDHIRGWCHSCYRRGRNSGEIKTLPVWDRNTKLSPLQTEMITGHMLGDGAIFRYYGKPRAYFSLLRKGSDVEYLRWSEKVLANIVTPSGVQEREVFDDRTHRTYYQCRFRTYALSSLNVFRDEWYCEDKKIVPKSLKLTPLVLALWFADDGSISSSANTYQDVLRAKFATDGFALCDTENLAEMLSERYDEYFGVSKNGSGYTIQAANKATRKLIDEIDSVLPAGIARKAYWRTLPSKPIARKPNHNGAKTHCAHGHLFSEENTHVNSKTGARTCRTCQRLYQRRLRSAASASATADV